jgi:GLPGLI family protein
MKSYLFSLMVVLFSFTADAQFTEGEIIYESKVNLHRNLPERMEPMKSQIPEFRTSKHVLQFTNQESYFFRKQNTEAEQGEFNADRRRFRRMGGGRDDVKLYTDLSTRISLESREFFGKKFLIEGEANDFKWKFTGESKQVGSYLCQKAIHRDTSMMVEAWFTPMIPVAAGPENFTGLPGLILHVDINEGERVITAMEVNNTKVDASAIVKPTEGEQISRADYRVMTREKMKEMREEYGGDRRGRMGRGH